MKNETRKIIVCLLAFICIGCATPRRQAVVLTGAGDPIVAEQQRVITEQRRTIDDMGRNVEQIRNDLESAREQLTRAIEQNNDLAEQWRAIDEFVRGVIRAEQALRDLQ